ncbi:MAG: hypothetical protein JO141_04890 [Bradyrhizobium sp.]|nr:hypothetical protein [Bradyrhizobium sp.]
MKIRGNMSTVGEGPDKDHPLLAAFLEATSRIDRRAVQRSVALPEASIGVDPEPDNLEAAPTSFEADPASQEADARPLEAAPTSLETSTDANVGVAVAPFTFRRANLVRA